MSKAHLLHDLENGRWLALKGLAGLALEDGLPVAAGWLWLEANRKWPMITVAGYTWRLRAPPVKIHKIEHQSYILPYTAAFHSRPERVNYSKPGRHHVALIPTMNLGALMEWTAGVVADAIKAKQAPYAEAT